MSDVFVSSYDPAPVREWAKSAPLKTLPALMANSVKNHGKIRFLGWKERGEYRYHTYEEAFQIAKNIGAALVELGLKAKERVALMSLNRPEWALTDIGTMQAAAVLVPIYATLSTEAAEYILNDSGSRVVIANDRENAEKLVAAKCECLEHIVIMGPKDGLESDKRLWTWDEFLAFGADCLSQHEGEMKARQEAISPTDVCSLVYTSGTTGKPKGAMLMHGNFLSNASAVLDALNLQPGMVQLSLLPLAHVLERLVYFGMMGAGVTICYAEAITTVKEDILVVRPHVLPAVPRLYEKIHAGVLAKVEAGGPLKQAIFNFCLGLGKKHFEAKQQGKVSFFTDLGFKIALKLALGKIHDALGGRIKILVSGGAPLRADVAEFFLHAGLTMSEGYGLTETSPAICFNPLDKPKIGTVGTTVKGVEVKIAPDGEILSKGPNTMLGYFKNVEATSECIDKDGWFSTGDIGELDSEGYLRITDRKKELLVMSNGKNVAPQPIEQAMKSNPYIEQVVLLGDNRKYITALVVPSWAALEKWLNENGLTAPPESVAKEKIFYDFLFQQCEQATHSFSHYEKPKKIAILAEELTQEGGELTPKLSVKRRVVETKYSEIIASLYPEE